MAVVGPAKANRGRDGAGEPEDGRHDVQREGREAVERRRQVQRRQADVDQHEYRPDRGEDKKVDGRGRVRIGCEAAVPETGPWSLC